MHKLEIDPDLSQNNRHIIQRANELGYFPPYSKIRLINHFLRLDLIQSSDDEIDNAIIKIMENPSRNDL